MADDTATKYLSDSKFGGKGKRKTNTGTRHRARLRDGMVSGLSGSTSFARQAGFQRRHGTSALLVQGLPVSEDMDFTLTEPTTLEDILAGFNEIYAAVETDSGIHIEFKGNKREQGRNSHTFSLRYQGPLPATNDVKVDITIDETFCYPLHERPMLRQYDMFNDLPEGPTVNIYSLEEIVVEKITALSDRKRNEPRDLYDLWYLLNHHDFWLAGMLPELETKLAFRQRTTEDVMENIAGKEERLSRLWTNRLSQQMIDLPAYDNVFRDVKRALHLR